jgi:hypothetical protein
MPTAIEAVIQPSEQDLIDLEKLYNDYPIEGVGFEQIKPMLNEASTTRIYGIRFNDRLLGAISVTAADEGNILNLDHLCVRAITRQRHVGRDMFMHLTKLLDTETLRFMPCIESEALDRTLRVAGFEKENNSWVLQR